MKIESLIQLAKEITAKKDFATIDYVIIYNGDSHIIMKPKVKEFLIKHLDFLKDKDFVDSDKNIGKVVLWTDSLNNKQYDEIERMLKSTKNF